MCWWRLRGDMPAGRPSTTALDTATYPAEPRVVGVAAKARVRPSPANGTTSPEGCQQPSRGAGVMPDARNTSVAGERRACP